MNPLQGTIAMLLAFQLFHYYIKSGFWKPLLSRINVNLSSLTFKTYLMFFCFQVNHSKDRLLNPVRYLKCLEQETGRNYDGKVALCVYFVPFFMAHFS